MVAEAVGFLPSGVLSFEEPRMLKAESFESEVMVKDGKAEQEIDVDVFIKLMKESFESPHLIAALTLGTYLGIPDLSRYSMELD